mmetsp:Transcript_2523/g.7010  ORF Transcript_2523/g.7010 Transcript_2523/m.7010 type:complete len:112 (-) Transcript_2523:167-502(-)
MALMQGGSYEIRRTDTLVLMSLKYSRQDSCVTTFEEAGSHCRVEKKPSAFNTMLPKAPGTDSTLVPRRIQRRVSKKPPKFVESCPRRTENDQKSTFLGENYSELAGACLTK